MLSSIHLIPLKLPREVEAFIANKVNENISVYLNKLPKPSREREKTWKQRQISNSEGDIMNINLWQDAVSQYAKN